MVQEAIIVIKVSTTNYRCSPTEEGGGGGQEQHDGGGRRVAGVADVGGVQVCGCAATP